MINEFGSVTPSPELSSALEKECARAGSLARLSTQLGIGRNTIRRVVARLPVRRGSLEIVERFLA